MAGLIPQDFIDDLLSRTDIVDVIGDYVQLRKAGKDFQGLCPFHTEKTPSFTVSQLKQFYHCFGCGANGSVIGFLMDYNHLDFVEAIKELASRAGMELPENNEIGRKRPDNEPIYSLLEDAARFFSLQLRQHPQKERAVHYLKNRGLTGKIAAMYRIGFAPPGWDNLLKTIGKSSEHLDLLQRAGLTIEKEGNDKSEKHYYDRFRDRIMFPIQDYKGRVIGFGGRIIDQGEPKYLNCPETPVFHKGRELYGLYEARKYCRDLDRILVVEGYMDVVALAQYDLQNTVATLGTAITSDHIQRLFKTTSEIVYCFDGDNAGRRAAWKALELSLPLLKEGRAVQFLFLPEGEDPDSMVRSRGKDFFENRENFTSLSDFLFTTLLQDVDIHRLEGRARLVDLAKPLIARLPQGALRSLMQQQLSELSRLTTDQIRQLVPPPYPEVEKPKPVQRSTTRRHRRLTRSLVEQAIHILLNYPHFALEIEFPMELEELTDPHLPLIQELIGLISDKPDITTGQLLEHWRNKKVYPTLAELVMARKELPESAIKTEYEGILQGLKNHLLKQRRSAVIQTSNGKITEQIKDVFRRKKQDQG